MFNRCPSYLLIITLILMNGFFDIPVWAHPGHGNPQLEQTPLHYLAEPQHGIVFLVGMGVALGALLWGIARRFRSGK